MNVNASTGGTEFFRPFRTIESRRAVWLLLVALTVATGVAPLSAATNEVRKLQPARWLFVVDTSSKMSDRSRATAGVIGELLASGINGQLKDGDQVGLWTFDKNLNAGVAPLQTWQSGQSNLIAGRTAKFVAELKFGGKSKLSAVVPELSRVVKESRRLTVLIYSEPSQTISGTPCDETLNNAYAAKKAENSSTRMPLVTVLRSEKGKLLGQTVAYAPWLEYPAFTPDPEALKPVKTAETKTTPEPKKAIIIGNDTKPPQPSTNVLVVSTPQPVQSAIETPATPAPGTQPVEPTTPPAPKPPSTPTQPPVSAAPTALVSSPAQQVTNPPSTIHPDKPAASVNTPDNVAEVAPEPAAANETQRDGGILSKKWLLVLGLGCMWVAIVMALLVIRRSRRPTRASLITRSFDRNRR
jgi:hypothetical protein